MPAVYLEKLFLNIRITIQEGDTNFHNTTYFLEFRNIALANTRIFNEVNKYNYWNTNEQLYYVFLNALYDDNSIEVEMFKT